MPALFDMKQDHHTAIKKAEQLIAAAEYAGRDLTETEAHDFDAAMAGAQALAPQIATAERKNTLASMMRGGKLLPGVDPSGRASSPILFEDFRQGYVIGDRGGSAINVKILDQPSAVQGQIALLAYRRTDGRVRRSEAIQTYTIVS